jgi:hypothetical protein
LYDLALQIRERFPTIPIVTGGQAFRWCDAQEVSGIEKLYVIRSLDELVTNFLTTSAYGS